MAKTNLKFRAEEQLYWSDVDDNFKALMYWSGKWAAGSYEANEVVTDGDWLMIANKATTDRAAPQPLGQEFDYFAGTLSPNTSVASQITFGSRYNNLLQPYFIKAWRIYATSGARYQVFRIIDPLGTPDQDELADFTATSTGWLSFSVGSVIVPLNTTLDIVAFVNQPDPAPTIWTGTWDYTTPNNEGTPAAGEILHANKELDIIRINVLDDVGGDRQLELEDMRVGDIIEGAGKSWTIVSQSILAGVVSFVVNPSSQGSPDGVQLFTFNTITASPIPYEEDTDYFLGNAAASGLFAVDGAPVVLNDNAYGIDVTIQDANISPDWDVMAYSGR